MNRWHVGAGVVLLGALALLFWKRKAIGAGMVAAAQGGGGAAPEPRQAFETSAAYAARTGSGTVLPSPKGGAVADPLQVYAGTTNPSGTTSGLVVSPSAQASATLPFVSNPRVVASPAGVGGLDPSIPPPKETGGDKPVTVLPANGSGAVRAPNVQAPVSYLSAIGDPTADLLANGSPFALGYGGLIKS